MGYAEDAMRELHGGGDFSSTVSLSTVSPVLQEVAAELAKARATHAPMNGHHEGYAVILEELDELWEVCKRNTHSRSLDPVDAPEELRYRKRLDMRKEAIQVAAMAIRFIEDVCDKE